MRRKIHKFKGNYKDLEPSELETRIKTLETIQGAIDELNTLKAKKVRGSMMMSSKTMETLKQPETNNSEEQK